MKKTLTVLAVMAIAAAAHADVLASWGASTTTNPCLVANGTLDSGYKFLDIDNPSIGVTDMALSAGVTKGSNTGYDVRLGSGGIATAELSFGYLVIADAIDNPTLDGKFHSTKAGPAEVDLLVNGNLTDKMEFANDTAVTKSYSLGSELTGEGTVQIKVNAEAGKVTDHSATPSGNFDLGNVTLSGDVRAVPEPATMSLLGLGALAMVLRRKLRK